MKISQFIIMIFVAAAVCGCRDERDARLAQLDSALWQNPDSVYDALMEIDTVSLGEGDRAFRRLLMAESADKSDHTDTTKATVSYLQDYYLDGNRDHELHARVNYILGRIYMERKEKAKGLEYFRKALRSSDEKTNSRLIMVIFGQMADLCSRSKLHLHGVEYSKGMVDNARKLNDSLMIARSELMLAFEYQGLNFLDSARQIYDRLAPFFTGIADPVQKTIYATQLASFYKECGDYEKADSVIRSSGIEVDASSRSSVGSIINDIDLHLGRTEDLERRSIDLLANNADIYARKTAARNLARIYLDREDGRRGFEYADKFYLIADSISAIEAAATIGELNEFYSQSELAEDNLELEKNNSILEQKKFWLVITAMTLFIGLAIILIIWQRNKIRSLKKINDLEKTLDERKKELQEMKEKLAEKAREIENKNVEISMKNSEIEQKSLEIESKNAEIEQKNSEIEERNREIESKNAEIERKNGEIEQKNREIESKNTEIERKNSEIEERNREIESKNAEIERKNSVIEERNREIESKNVEIERKDSMIEERNREIESKNVEIEQKDSMIEERNREIESKNAEIGRKDSEIESKNNEIDRKNSEIESKNTEIERKDSEIERRKRKLEMIVSNIDNVKFKNEFLENNRLGATDGELARLDEFIKKFDQKFYESMEELRLNMELSERDFYDTLLIRLAINLKGCGGILQISSEALSMQRIRLFAKVVDKRGAKKWEEYIRSFRVR